MTLAIKELPPVLSPFDSQMIHHQADPTLPEAPKDEVIHNIEALNMACNFGGAEAYLTEMAARSVHDIRTPHHVRASTFEGARAHTVPTTRFEKFSRFLNRLYGY